MNFSVGLAPNPSWTPVLHSVLEVGGRPWPLRHNLTCHATQNTTCEVKVQLLYGLAVHIG